MRLVLLSVGLAEAMLAGTLLPGAGGGAPGSGPVSSLGNYRDLPALRHSRPGDCAGDRARDRAADRGAQLQCQLGELAGRVRRSDDHRLSTRVPRFIGWTSKHEPDDLTRLRVPGHSTNRLREWCHPGQNREMSLPAPIRVGFLLPLLPAQRTARPAELGMLETQLRELFLLSCCKDERLLAPPADAFVVLELHHRHPRSALGAQILLRCLEWLCKPAPESLEGTTNGSTRLRPSPCL